MISGPHFFPLIPYSVLLKQQAGRLDMHHLVSLTGLTTVATVSSPGLDQCLPI